MTTAIFVRSYPKDFGWLAHCLKSIHKYATGFSEVVVAIPEGTRLNLTAERVVEVEEKVDGYMEQQISKLNADLYTGADNILYVDSDCVFTEAVTPEVFMTGEKPNWLITPMAVVGEDARKAWAPVMEDCIGHAPPFEFMRRHPQMIPRWALMAFREFIRDRHKKGMEEYVRGRPHRSFSEFNVIGFYLYTHHHDKFHWMNTEDGIPPIVLKQFWSHGGLKPEVREEIKGYLG